MRGSREREGKTGRAKRGRLKERAPGGGDCAPESAKSGRLPQGEPGGQPAGRWGLGEGGGHEQVGKLPDRHAPLEKEVLGGVVPEGLSIWTEDLTVEGEGGEGDVCCGQGGRENCGVGVKERCEVTVPARGEGEMPEDEGVAEKSASPEREAEGLKCNGFPRGCWGGEDLINPFCVLGLCALFGVEDPES